MSPNTCNPCPSLYTPADPASYLSFAISVFSEMGERKRALLSTERKATIPPGLARGRTGEAPADPASYLSLAYKEFWQGILTNSTTKKLYA